MRFVLRPLLRGGLLALVAVVAAYHLWILAERFADGSVVEPLVAGRWLGSAALAGLILVLRRRGGSPWRGHTALVFWLLVVLLHGVGGFAAEDELAGPPVPAETLWLTAPLGLAVTAVFWAGAVSVRRTAGGPADADRRRTPGLSVCSGWTDPRLATAGPRAPPS